MTHHRALLIIALALPLACIDDSKSGSDATTSDATAADAQQEVDTGGLTCGKCAQLWHTDTVFIDGVQNTCFIDNGTSVQCCPMNGDCCFSGPSGCCSREQGTCPKAGAGYEWRACADVREAFGRAYCMDADAYVEGDEASERGAFCVEQSLGCSELPPSN